MSEWKPIETAPRDGTEILIAVKLEWNHENDSDIRIGKGWYIAGAYWWDGKKFLNRIDHWVSGEINQLRWIALPAPPNNKQPETDSPAQS